MTAVRKMKEGKKVRSKRWMTGSYIYTEEDLIKHSKTDREGYKGFISDIEATDWEIHEEKEYCEKHYNRCCLLCQKEDDDWNLVEHGHEEGDSTIMKSHQAIKTFIQKTKEKIKKGVDPIKALNETAGDL